MFKINESKCKRPLITPMSLDKSQDTLPTERNIGRASQAIREKCSKGVKMVWNERKLSLCTNGMIMYKENPGESLGNLLRRELLIATEYKSNIQKGICIPLYQQQIIKKKQHLTSIILKIHKNSTTKYLKNTYPNRNKQLYEEHERRCNE